MNFCMLSWIEKEMALKIKERKKKNLLVSYLSLSHNFPLHSVVLLRVVRNKSLQQSR